MSGIYYIRNVQTQRIYVGKTTRSFIERWKEHARELRAHEHHNTLLQQDFIAYGDDSFYCGIIVKLYLTGTIDRAERILIRWHLQEYAMYNIEGVNVPFHEEKRDAGHIDANYHDSESTDVGYSASQRYFRVLAQNEEAQKGQKGAFALLEKMHKTSEDSVRTLNRYLSKSELILKTWNIAPGRSKAYKAASKVYDYGKEKGLWE